MKAQSQNISCIFCEYSRTLLVISAIYVIWLTLTLMNYFICIRWILFNVCCCLIPSWLTCELFHRLIRDVFMLVFSFQAAHYYRHLRGHLIFPSCVRTFHALKLILCKVIRLFTKVMMTPLYALLQPRHIIKTHCFVNRAIFRMGLIHQMVWGLIGTSYRRDPLNIGGSNTVNTFLWTWKSYSLRPCFLFSTTLPELSCGLN